MKLYIFCLLIYIIFIGAEGCSKKNSSTPILIIAANTNFGTYIGEILKTEGFNEFKTDSPSCRKINLPYLKQFDLVVLAEFEIDQALKKAICNFVRNGGNLIAFRPDPILAELFGITPAEGNIADGYMAMDTITEQGKGLTGKTIQFHGTADKYTVNTAGIIAKICDDPFAGCTFPAVVSNNYGKGRVVAFLYNLPKSIVYTRQGNPEFAGIEKDGIPGLRGMDLFTDGWLDTSKNNLNQADEQMALFSHCIEGMFVGEKPLPRFWYFPDTLKCLVTLTNDGEFRTETDFEPQFRDVDSMGASMSLYILEVNKVSKAWVDKWKARGFEIAGHPDDTKEAGNPGWNRMDSALKERKTEIRTAYGLPIRTNVNHWFVWCGRDVDGNQDFAAQAKLEELNGFELDVNYAHYDMKSNQGKYYLGTPGTNQGNFTGSGLVMKYAGADGNTINVYQHVNAVYDQQYNESHDPEGFYNCFKGLADRSLNAEVYSFISIKSHNDEYNFSKVPLMKMLAYAKSHGIPVWPAIRLLDFVKMKDEASFSGINWANNRLTFDLKSSLESYGGLTFMLPLRHGGLKISTIAVNNMETPFIIRKVKGRDYALATVAPGRDYKVSAKYR